MGLRAQESAHRQRLEPFAINPALTIRKRTVYNWLPVHKLTTEQVFEQIRRAGQEPFWAYKAGNQRLSCVFCILGCASTWRTGASTGPSCSTSTPRWRRRPADDVRRTIPEGTHRGRRDAKAVEELPCNCW